MSLVLDQVALTIAGRPLVKQVSLNLNPGEVVGLLGPNGAGKTTTFNLVTGLLRPDSGAGPVDRGHPQRQARRASRWPGRPREHRFQCPLLVRDLRRGSGVPTGPGGEHEPGGPVQGQGLLLPLASGPPGHGGGCAQVCLAQL